VCPLLAFCQCDSIASLAAVPVAGKSGKIPDGSRAREGQNSSSKNAQQSKSRQAFLIVRL
jgi:hypothetical protein